jgi:predicted Rossmann fold flavoprotein
MGRHRNHGSDHVDEINEMKKQLIVIGGGAAGFFCAVNAARMNRDLKVTLLEKTGKLLSKVKVSGGGRCNVTHACFDIVEMSRRYPRGGNFVKKAFHQFFTNDTLQWFAERGVKLKEEADGRMFPVTDSSQTIIDCLLREAGRYDVTIEMHAVVTELNYDKQGFSVILENGKHVTADYVCVAAGGFSKPAMFDWLRHTGHSIASPVPSLFTFNLPGHPITQLMGVSIENARIKIAGTKLVQEGPVLITHWGLSGPAILRLSAWAARELAELNWNFSIVLNWLPQHDEQRLGKLFQQLRTEQASQKISGRSPVGLPQRFWLFLLEQASISLEWRWADLPSKAQNKLAGLLCNYHVVVKGKTTFKEEFVTAGGVSLNEIDPNTMMSRKIPHLFFAGEIMDVDGITGGFNFQHAWTSGFVAAKHITLLSTTANEASGT